MPIVEKLIDYLYKGDYDDGNMTVQDWQHTSCNSPVLYLTTPHIHMLGGSSSAPSYAATDDDADTETDADADANADDDDSPLAINIKMYIIADKYDIEDLKELACSKSIPAMRGMKDMYATLTKCIRFLYENTMEEDRKMKITVMGKVLVVIDTLRNYPDFDALLQERGDLAYDLVQGMMQNHVDTLPVLKHNYDFIYPAV